MPVVCCHVGHSPRPERLPLRLLVAPLPEVALVRAQEVLRAVAKAPVAHLVLSVVRAVMVPILSQDQLRDLQHLRQLGTPGELPRRLHRARRNGSLPGSLSAEPSGARDPPAAVEAIAAPPPATYVRTAALAGPRRVPSPGAARRRHLPASFRVSPRAASPRR